MACRAREAAALSVTVTPMHCDALLFDLDGVLVDSVSAHGARPDRRTFP